jgi:L-threonylcarbamoyladenylate synthase
MNAEKKHFTLDPATPDPGLIAKAAAVIRGGGVVVFPTQGLYGLGADALNPAAVDRIFALKGRDPGKPLLVLIHRRGQLDRLAAEVNAPARHLMDRFWPGQVTFVLPAAPGLPRGLVSTEGKIGVRLAGHPVAVALAAAVGGPVTGTSANRSGEGGCADLARLQPEVRAAADLILDAGPLAGGPGSTVVDPGVAPPLILREGSVPAKEILAACAGCSPDKI